MKEGNSFFNLVVGRKKCQRKSKSFCTRYLTFFTHSGSSLLLLMKFIAFCWWSIKKDCRRLVTLRLPEIEPRELAGFHWDNPYIPDLILLTWDTNIQIQRHWKWRCQCPSSISTRKSIAGWNERSCNLCAISSLIKRESSPSRPS